MAFDPIIAVVSGTILPIAVTGSLQTYGAIGIGSSLITNFPAIYATSGNVNVNNPATIGSITLQNISGTVTVDNRVAGSIVNMPLVSISGIVNQGTSPWIISGAISNFPALYAVSGIVNQGTTPWSISGAISALPIGSNLLLSSAGSINVVNLSGTFYPYLGVGSITGQVTIGAGSIQTYSPIGIGSTYNLNSRFPTYSTRGIILQTVGSSLISFYNSGPNASAVYNIRKIRMAPINTTIGAVFMGDIRRVDTIFPSGGATAFTGSHSFYDTNNPAIPLTEAATGLLSVRYGGKDTTLNLGSFITSFGYSYGGTNSNCFAEDVIWMQDVGDYNMPITLRANQGIAVMQTLGSATGSVAIVIEWYRSV